MLDPTLFRIDWEVLSEVLVSIIVLAFLLERALSLLFEHRLFVNRLESKGFKEPIALLVAFAVVRAWQFDAVSVIFQAEQQTVLGHLITAAVVAGGSKASVKLFRDLWGVKSTAAQLKDDQKKLARQEQIELAQVR
jgi:hypothetical protein